MNWTKGILFVQFLFVVNCDEYCMRRNLYITTMVANAKIRLLSRTSSFRRQEINFLVARRYIELFVMSHEKHSAQARRPDLCGFLFAEN